MIVFLVKLIFFAINTLLNLVTRLIFSGTAHFIVLFIQAFKVPGQAIQGGLEQIAEAIRACFEYIMELVMEAISSLISSAFEFIIEIVKESISGAGSTVGGLAESTKSSLEGLLKDLPEVAEGFSEMIANVVSDLWNNYLEAVGYVKENA